MSASIEYPYVRKKIVKYETNILNVPELFGRLIVGLVSFVNHLKSHDYLLSEHLDSLCLFMYDCPQTKPRRRYIRNFVKRKRSFLTKFIKDNEIKKKTSKHFKFQTFEEIGMVARHDIIIDDGTPQRSRETELSCSIDRSNNLEDRESELEADDSRKREHDYEAGSKMHNLADTHANQAKDDRNRAESTVGIETENQALDRQTINSDNENDGDQAEFNNNYTESATERENRNSDLNLQIIISATGSDTDQAQSANLQAESAVEIEAASPCLNQQIMDIDKADDGDGAGSHNVDAESATELKGTSFDSNLQTIVSDTRSDTDEPQSANLQTESTVEIEAPSPGLNQREMGNDEADDGDNAGSNNIDAESATELRGASLDLNLQTINSEKKDGRGQGQSINNQSESAMELDVVNPVSNQQTLNSDEAKDDNTYTTKNNDSGAHENTGSVKRKRKRRGRLELLLARW